jgi:hypothetical protein
VMDGRYIEKSCLSGQKEINIITNHQYQEVFLCVEK